MIDAGDYVQHPALRSALNPGPERFAANVAFYPG
jgi:hypothetical protein